MSTVEDSERIQEEIQKLQREAETLRKAGSWTVLASSAGTIAAGIAVPALAPLIGITASGAAAAMLYKKISDQREIAARQATLRQSGLVFGRRPELQSG
jgi:C4-dicarboxylate-specific signal transduction histidine kinase